ncbi:hypothetical protein [Streptomyces sp. NPDC096132]|uniref:hypothetical protein n=1 Tax=Streptomyces sp. NPDC096132 TaxID=3366075 RepID=UPI0037F5F431
MLPVTAIRMVEVGSLRAMARAARSDLLILVLTAVATLALDFVHAVIIGLAGSLPLRTVAKQARPHQCVFPDRSVEFLERTTGRPTQDVDR